MAPMVTPELASKLFSNKVPSPPPCPENWQSCDHCGALSGETCRNPDVNETHTALKRGPDIAVTLDDLPRLADVPTDKPLIGITGYKRAGKDTAAAVIASILGYDLVQFAGTLKDMMRALLAGQGMPVEEIERYVEGDLKDDPTPHLLGNSPRHAMQTLGTEWGREQLDDSIWVTMALRAAARAAKGAIITDVRFPNEARAVRAAGGFLIRVERAELEQTSAHASEVHIKDIPVDQILRNDRDRESFQGKVAAWTWKTFLKP